MSRNSEGIHKKNFLRKIGGFLNGNLYSSKCQSCRKDFSKRIWFWNKRYAIKKLARKLNTCSVCQKNVCDDCYIIITNGQLFEGICIECSKEQGIIGLTTTEYMNGVSLYEKLKK